jgi:glutamine synthetase adenylyltransferase
VVARVQEDVAKRAVHLARRRQYAVMVAIREHATRAARNPIHGTCEPYADRLHAASERVAILGFDDQVRVVAEQRIVHQPKIAAIAAGRKGPLELPHDADIAQGR